MRTHIPAIVETLGNSRTAFPKEAHPGLPGGESGRWLKVLTKFLGTVWFEVPIGYQDETGFHYGEAPARAEICYQGDW